MIILRTRHLPPQDKQLRQSVKQCFFYQNVEDPAALPTVAVHKQLYSIQLGLGGECDNARQFHPKWCWALSAVTMIETASGV